MKKLHGFTLTEVFISLLLGSIMLQMLLVNYTTIKFRTQKNQANLMQLSELNLVTDVMKKSIHSAGFTPGINIDRLQTSNEAGFSLKAVQIINKNRLCISRMSEKFSAVLEFTKNFLLLVNDEIGVINTNHNIIIADYYHAEIKKIHKKIGNKIMLSSPLKYTYTKPLYVGEWLTEEFFLQKSKNDEYSLFYKMHDTEELSSLITSLHITQQEKLINVILGTKDTTKLEFSAVIRAN